MNKASDIQDVVEYTIVAAPFDTNGNPRRLFELIWGTYPYSTAVVDDGYCGENWIHARTAKGLITRGGRERRITATEYKKMLKSNTQYENA